MYSPQVAQPAGLFNRLYEAAPPLARRAMVTKMVMVRAPTAHSRTPTLSPPRVLHACVSRSATLAAQSTTDEE